MSNHSVFCSSVRWWTWC